MGRGPYKTVGKLLKELREIVSETGWATMNLYYSERKEYYVSYPCQGVEIHGGDLKEVLKESIDYIRSERRVQVSTDKRKQKYTLKPE